MLRGLGVAMCGAALLTLGCSSSDSGNAGAAGAETGGGAGAGGTAGAAGTSVGGAAGTAGAGGANGVAIGGDCSIKKCVPEALCMDDPCEAVDDCPRTCKRIVPACVDGACAAQEYCTTYIDTSKVQHGYCSPQSQANAVCDSFATDQCVSGYYCAQDADNGLVYHCNKVGGANEPCTVDPGACIAGYRCSDTIGNMVCVKSTPLDGDCMNTFECDTGLFCSKDTNTCQTVNQAGGDCRPDSYSCENNDCHILSSYCAAGLNCVKSGSGGSCFSDHDCQSSTGICCADKNNAGSCQTDHFCLRPLGKCAAP